MVMYTMTEMVAARPIAGPLIDFPNKFCSAELGFAVGVTYWLAQAMCMAALNASTARIVDDFSSVPLDKGKRTALILGLIFVTGFSNLIGVRLYGQIERVVAALKMALILFLAALMIGVNSGLGGQRTGHRYANFTTFGIVTEFRPEGFNGTTGVNGITLYQKAEPSYGIPSKSGGRLFTILTAIAIAMFNVMGGDQVFMTAGEARDPWNDLPAVTRLIYGIPLVCYPILTTLVGFAVNYADPNLYRPWARFNTNVSHSPYIIALKHTSFGPLPTVLNSLFLLSGYTCG
jgi:amino acid transporter